MADVDLTYGQQIVDIPQGQQDPAYIISTRRMARGDESKYLNGLTGFFWHGNTPPRPIST